jgi:hypothetical protein
MARGRPWKLSKTPATQVIDQGSPKFIWTPKVFWAKKYITVQKFGVTSKCPCFCFKKTLFLSIKITSNWSEIQCRHC